MALSTSFTGGWFYGGQFFENASGWYHGSVEEIARNARQRDEQDIVRSRGRFQVLTTVDDVIAELAEELVDEDSEQEVLRALRAAIAAHHIDWDDGFLQQLLDVRESLPAWQERQQQKAAAARADWLERRQRKLRAH